MGFAAAALPFIAAGAQAAGTLFQGLYAGQVASNNAQIERQNAQYAEEAGQQQAATQSLKGAAKSAEIKNAQAANGIDVNSGSAVDVQVSQRGQNELDTDTVLNNADLQAYGYTTQAVNQDAQAKQDVVGGILGAAGSLAGNASSVNLGKWGTVAGGTGGSAAAATPSFWG